jgi:sterol desaturase/sphingolipid hydroxylase (fatty acid hydroxylase superfamily)
MRAAFMNLKFHRRAGFLLALLALGAIALFAAPRLDDGAAAWGGRKLTALANDVLYSPLRSRVVDRILTADFLIVMALTLLLERLIPAHPRQNWLSASALQDAAWFFYEAVLHAAIIATWVTLLVWFYRRYLASQPIAHFGALSIGMRFVIATVLVDLCMWIQHRVNHAVPWFWQFHKVHHSQRELSFFTDFRYHVFEYVVRETFLAIPFIVLGVRVPVIVYFSAFRRWYTPFYHANIKTDLGPLRYLLATPQSHRIHHSIEPRHQNKNFGSLFSIWDFAFGTQYTKWDEYPDTGIEDHEFPHETRADLRSLLVTPIRQMLFPLHRIAEQVASWRPAGPREQSMRQRTPRASPDGSTKPIS